MQFCFLLFLFLLQTGCSTFYFFYQAGQGQLKILNRVRPIEDVIRDPHTSSEVVALLKQIPAVKKFGEESGLKPTSNYREYVDLKEDAVVYVVTVTDPYELKAHEFRFPIVGSFNYIGWFAKEDAEKFAEPYREAGKDVDVRGASAYSTLGWFKDPLLSSMIPKNQMGRVSKTALARLVNVVLHESVHATLYIENQSYFNEGVATFIGDRLTEKYFKSLATKEAFQIFQQYEAEEKKSETLRADLNRYANQVKKLYDELNANQVPASDRQAKKTALYEALNADLKQRYPWMKPMNNASLVQYLTYHSSEAEFWSLYRKKNEDVRAVLESLRKLSKDQFKHPHQEGGFEGLWGQL